MVSIAGSYMYMYIVSSSNHIHVGAQQCCCYHVQCSLLVYTNTHSYWNQYSLSLPSPSLPLSLIPPSLPPSLPPFLSPSLPSYLPPFLPLYRLPSSVLSKDTVLLLSRRSTFSQPFFDPIPYSLSSCYPLFILPLTLPTSHLPLPLQLPVHADRAVPLPRDSPGKEHRGGVWGRGVGMETFR